MIPTLFTLTIDELGNVKVSCKNCGELAELSNVLFDDEDWYMEMIDAIDVHGPGLCAD